MGGENKVVGRWRSSSVGQTGGEPGGIWDSVTLCIRAQCLKERETRGQSTKNEEEVWVKEGWTDKGVLKSLTYPVLGRSYKTVTSDQTEASIITTDLKWKCTLLPVTFKINVPSQTINPEQFVSLCSELSCSVSVQILRMNGEDSLFDQLSKCSRVMFVYNSLRITSPDFHRLESSVTREELQFVAFHQKTLI